MLSCIHSHPGPQVGRPRKMVHCVLLPPRVWRLRLLSPSMTWEVCHITCGWKSKTPLGLTHRSPSMSPLSFLSKGPGSTPVLGGSPKPPRLFKDSQTVPGMAVPPPPQRPQLLVPQPWVALCTDLWLRRHCPRGLGVPRLCSGGHIAAGF